MLRGAFDEQRYEVANRVPLELRPTIGHGSLDHGGRDVREHLDESLHGLGDGTVFLGAIHTPNFLQVSPG